MVVAEAVEAISPGQIRLGLADGDVAEMVEAEVGGHGRLIVAWEQGFTAADVRPLREALAPPRIVLRRWVELREIEGDRFGASGLGGGQERPADFLGGLARGPEKAGQWFRRRGRTDGQHPQPVAVMELEMRVLQAELFPQLPDTPPPLAHPHAVQQCDRVWARLRQPGLEVA